MSIFNAWYLLLLLYSTQGTQIQVKKKIKIKSEFSSMSLGHLNKFDHYLAP
jgi:hypothetical protein